MKEMTVTITVPCEIDVVIGPDCDGGIEPRRVGLVTLDMDGQIFEIGNDAQIKGVSPEDVNDHILNYYPDEIMNIIKEMDKKEREEHFKDNAY